MTTLARGTICQDPTVHPIARHHVNCVNIKTGPEFKTSLFETISKWWKTYRQSRIDREAFSQLHKLDDRLLGDIGVKRSDVVWASQLPLSQNASTALEIRARANSKTRR